MWFYIILFSFLILGVLECLVMITYGFGIVYEIILGLMAILMAIQLVTNPIQKKLNFKERFREFLFFSIIGLVFLALLIFNIFKVNIVLFGIILVCIVVIATIIQICLIITYFF